ncbi:MAG: hypothetical protein M3014_02135, partial [Chloroflexota bacterium]|nr:hypothetical protein [Chloroflexota bacterium]
GATTAVQAQASTPTGGQPTYANPTGTIVDASTVIAQPTAVENDSSPTPVAATATGAALTAMQALAILKARAIAWKPDARLAMLSNVRPGQETRVLGSALGDPNVNEPTPGGRGKNWTLIAFSPSGAAAVFDMEGGQNDLIKAGVATDDMLNAFKGAGLAGLELAKLDTKSLTDSDKAIAGAAGDKAGIALISPVGLGLGPLPAAKAGGLPPALAYEIYSTDPAKQAFKFLDAQSGEVVLDSSTP